MQSSGVRSLLDINEFYWPPPIDGGRYPHWRKS
jgi:hypothetical protein